jgi:carboxylesterase type B
LVKINFFPKSSWPICFFAGQASDGSNQFRGNFAYWDMAEALRWLRAELPAFGGDPQRITAWGYSSGSSSVGTLSISPQTRRGFIEFN